MALTRRQIDRLAQAIKSHTDWLYATLSGNALSAAELTKIKEYNLPLDLDVNLVKNGYALGLLRMLLKRTEYVETDFDELLNVAKADRSTVEDLTIHQAMTSAGAHIKRLGEAIGNEIFTEVNAAGQAAVNEALVKDVIKDTVAFGLIKRKNYMQVATDLASNLKADRQKDWRMVAETELVRARTQGQVQALVNKADIYKYSEGINSSVSVVPAPDCCKDCTRVYLGRDGNPKVFKLSWLIEQGSNADAGTNHSKVDGEHPHWKTTLSPLHPRCGCSLTYVPPGYGWVERRLVLIDKDAYRESLTKSMELRKAKEYTPFSATAKPMGPASAEKTPAGMPSMPGADSVSRTPSGPATGPTGTVMSSPKSPANLSPEPEGANKQDMVDCPLGAAGCEAAGGSGKHHPDSVMYQEHQKMAQNQGMGAPNEEATSASPEQKQQDTQQKVMAAVAWQKDPHPPSVIESHLRTGKVAHEKDVMAGVTGGATKPKKLTIEGNGSGCFKAERAESLSMYHWTNVGLSESMGVVAENTSHKREVAAYNHNASYGTTQVPVTTTRTHDGAEGSIQHWIEDSENVNVQYTTMDPTVKQQFTHKGTGITNDAQFMISQAKDSDQAVEELSRSIVHDIMINHTDRHSGNLNHSIKDGKLQIHAIDNAGAYGRGLDMFRNDLFSDMQRAGYKVSIPKDLQQKMRNRSFGDEVRSIGSHVSKREAAETFIRTKYALHLQDTEGHLDYKRFTTFLKDRKGNAGPLQREIDLRGAKAIEEYTEANGTPHDQYQRFEADFLRQLKDPDHPHHADYASIRDALNTEDRAAEHPLARRDRQLREAVEGTQSSMSEFNKLQQKHKESLKEQYAKTEKAPTEETPKESPYVKTAQSPRRRG